MIGTSKKRLDTGSISCCSRVGRCNNTGWQGQLCGLARDEGGSEKDASIKRGRKPVNAYTHVRVAGAVVQKPSDQ